MRRTQKDQRGYVLVVVLVLTVVLLSAGVFGLRRMESEVRASTNTRRFEFLNRAAEAGAAERIAQIQLATEDAGAAFASEVPPTAWPSSTFSTSGNYDLNNTTQYSVQTRLVTTVTADPPPGVQVGTGGQTTLWEVTSVAVWTNNAGGVSLSAGGESQVSVGVSVYSRGGMSYNN